MIQNRGFGQNAGRVRAQLQQSEPVVIQQYGRTYTPVYAPVQDDTITHVFPVICGAPNPACVLDGCTVVRIRHKQQPWKHAYPLALQRFVTRFALDCTH